MSLYTKAGDEGDTSCLGGGRIRKSDALCEAIGTIDELNAHVGLCLRIAEAGKGRHIGRVLRPVESELFAIGAIFAAAGVASESNARLCGEAVGRMEKQIDDICEKLPRLEHFILPEGCELGCQLQVARTVCRRAERRIVAAADTGTKTPPAVLQYVNRLGDLLFALARLANHDSGYEEVYWSP